MELGGSGVVTAEGVDTGDLGEHNLASESGEGIETLDLVRVGADGSPHWSRVWPTPEENPRHAGLEFWMACHGYQIVSRPASYFDRCEDEVD